MLTLIDPGQTLSPAQRDALTAKAHAYPFDLVVEIQTRYAVSRASFEHQVALKVTPGSRVVSIGVDPFQHYTFVRSSAALGVPPGPQVAQAGNAFFRGGNLVDGIDAIAAKANELRVEPRAPVPFVPGTDQRVVSSQAGVPIVIQENHTAAGVWWGLGAFILAAAGVVAYAVWRARKARLAARAAEEAAASEAAELAARNIEEAGWHDAMAERRRSSRPEPHEVSFVPTPADFLDPPVRRVRQTSPLKARSSVAPAPAPVVVVQQPSSSLDLVLSYELGRSAAQPARVIVEREYVPTPSPSSSYSPFDSSSSGDSSSSSSWDSSSDSSSSSSFDSSSGGSDSSSGSDW